MRHLDLRQHFTHPFTPDWGQSLHGLRDLLMHQLTGQGGQDPADGVGDCGVESAVELRFRDQSVDTAIAHQIVGIDHREVALTLLRRSLEDAERTRLHGIIDLLTGQPQSHEIAVTSEQLGWGVLSCRHGVEVVAIRLIHGKEKVPELQAGVDPRKGQVSTLGMKSGRVGLWMGLLWLLAVRSWAGETATAVATVTSGFVSGITVTSAGAGYPSEPPVTISGGGGSGATAKAILSGDKVSAIVVLTAGSGYSSIPAVTIGAPPEDLGLEVELVPKIKVRGSAGSSAIVQWSLDSGGPWIDWTNVTTQTGGVVLVDLAPDATTRFYRAISKPSNPGPAPQGFVWIPPGTFVMGSPPGEEGRWDDEVQHTATVTQGFWLSDHEVTQGEYQAVIGNNPSHFKGDLNRPVELVSWDDAVAYCQKLTDQERAAGRITPQQTYRLPTETEWEYAARAGTTGARYGELDAIAWWEGNSGNQTQPVKQKDPNAWGLYDMLGNAWEWCSDWYGAYPTASVTDPTGPSSGSGRVYRGGRWFNGGGYGPRYVRSASRNRLVPGNRLYDLGFRPALSSVR